MKILGVRFKNLNSLAGEWQIDFTHPEYVSNGIFAITGPTGAGKTTIMDAICLGLYGTTPRLDRVTKSSNEIMSRRTGECFAEVTFETQRGRYRCHWSQHRSRRKPDGELQQARHEIAAADSATVLESKINQVSEFITEVTGMDFERFSRSMLLAQGGFATFLLAPPGKRGDVLEQITGTEIYSRISVQVHHRLTAERGKLALLQAELQVLKILSPEEERELQAELTTQLARETETAGQKEKLRQALAWREGMAALERELALLDKEWQDCEKRRQDFEPALRRLNRAKQALLLEGDYRSMTALRGQQAEEIKELTAAVAQLPAREQAGNAATACQEAAATRLREAQKRQLFVGDILKKVRELDARRAEMEKQLAEQDKAIRLAERQKSEYERHRAEVGRALQDIQDDLQAIQDYQTTYAADDALTANLAAIGRGFEALREKTLSLSQAREALSATIGKKEAATTVCKRLEVDQEATRREFEQGQKELERLGKEIGSLLKEREISQWRDEQEARKDRERLLAQAGEALARGDEALQALAHINNDLQALTVRQAQLTVEIKAGEEKRERLEKEKAGLETQVSLLARIRDLEEERKRLEDGRPCPLCGSIEHPYAWGNLPARNETENQFHDVSLLCKQAAQEISNLEAARERTMAEIRQREIMREEKQAALKKEEALATATLGNLHIRLNEEDRAAAAAAVQAELTCLQAEIAAMSPLISAAEDIVRQERASQSALQKRKERLETVERALQEARHELATADHEQERLHRECEALRLQTTTLSAAALRDVEPFNIRQLPLDNLDNIRHELTARRDKWQAKAAEKGGREKRSDELKAELDKGNALLANLEKSLVARRRERDELRDKQADMDVTRRELFGDKNPDEEEKLLQNAVTQAGEALEKTRAAAMQTVKEVLVLKDKIASLQDKTRKRAGELAGAEDLLTERLSKAYFADEADYLAACLSEEEREGLSATEIYLLRERTALGTRRKDKAETLQTERNREVTNQPSDALRADLEACELSLKQFQEGISALKNRLQENEKSRAKQQQRQLEAEGQKLECKRWDELHQIIGSADGKKFRNFAQGLTFEMLTKHANRRLRKMTDRYLLVRDTLQPLELNVIDNYQAGEVRSTKNLSGGESFIVSLSLALGLSQMASRNVRVDSLFLDEGFGTLDEDALETALETLAGLRQDGKLIGVISHVAALKERIATQIQVTPATGGRSSIAGPGCRNIGNAP